MIIPSIAGEDVVPGVELEPKDGPPERVLPPIPEAMPTPLLAIEDEELAAKDLPVKRGFSWSFTSKSAPVGPRVGVTEMVAGILSFGEDLEVVLEEKDSKAKGPRRSTS